MITLQQNVKNRGGDGDGGGCDGCHVGGDSSGDALSFSPSTSDNSVFAKTQLYCRGLAEKAGSGVYSAVYSLLTTENRDFPSEDK